jgi:hypothetical protein
LNATFHIEVSAGLTFSPLYIHFVPDVFVEIVDTRSSTITPAALRTLRIRGTHYTKIPKIVRHYLLQKHNVASCLKYAVDGWAGISSGCDTNVKQHSHCGFVLLFGTLVRLNESCVYKNLQGSCRLCKRRVQAFIRVTTEHDRKNPLSLWE